MARYLASDWVRQIAGDAMPWGTLAVNVIGSFAIGFFLVWLQSTTPSAHARQLVAIGFLGSFTTFSTFSYEAVELTRAGEWMRAGGYAMGSVALGMCAVMLGASLAILIFQPES